jgi:hypothetical protein
MNVTRRIICWAAVAAAVAGIGAADAVTATAVPPQVGTADFRTAPVLADGTYDDTIIPKETVWYAFRISAPNQRVEVAAAVDDPALAERLTLTVEIVGPDLAPVVRGDNGTAAAELAFGQPQPGESTTWYVSMSASSAGSRLVDVLVPVTVSLAGADPVDVASCVQPDCALATEADELRTEIERLETTLTEAGVGGGAADEVRPDALTEEQRLVLYEERRRLQAELAAAEPSAQRWTPLSMVGFAVLGLVVGGGVVTVLARRHARRALADELDSADELDESTDTELVGSTARAAE